MHDDNLTPDEALEETANKDYDSNVGYKDILPEDNDRPFKPADNPTANAMPMDHPNTDSNVDLHEQYDAGVSEASGYSTQDGSGNHEEPERLA